MFLKVVICFLAKLIDLCVCLETIILVDEKAVTYVLSDFAIVPFRDVKTFFEIKFESLNSSLSVNQQQSILKKTKYNESNDKEFQVYQLCISRNFDDDENIALWAETENEHS